MGVTYHRNYKLRSYRGRFPSEVSSVVRRYAAKIDDLATSRARRKTGTLKRSISHRMLGEMEAAIGSQGLPYARIQDLGGQTSNQYGPNTGYITGNAYLTGSFNELLPGFKGAIRQVLRP